MLKCILRNLLFRSVDILLAIKLDLKEELFDPIDGPELALPEHRHQPKEGAVPEYLFQA